VTEEGPHGETTVTRRGFLGWVFGVGAAIVALVAGVPAIGALVGQPPPAKPAGFVVVGPVDSLQTGEPVGLTLVSETQDAFEYSLLPHNVWAVKNAGGTVAVFSPVCTHLGCQVFWDAGRQQFVCPCHNSVFSKDGAYVSGPAPRGLDVLPSTVKDGVLSVQWVDYVPGLAVKTPV
jgi:menaquinol-cytochrome c reductase iron-sulfur subunit